MGQIQVAVIEDDSAIRQMYAFKLEGSGFRVCTATNGEEGLEIVRRYNPQLILLDLKMPVMDGVVMLEKLRASEYGDAVKVLILTNSSKSEAPNNLRFLHVDRYIVKAHHTPKQVVEIVQETLGQLS